MIILTENTDKLKIKLDGAVTTNELDIILCYDEITSTSRDEGRNVAKTNGATFVDLCVGSVVPITINIDYINVFNNDMVNVNVNIVFEDNGTDYVIKKVTLLPNEVLEYTNENGWSIK